jgi:transposase
VRPTVARDKLYELIAALPPCTIGMEACSGAHHWARLFTACGHTVRLIAPKFVTPYRMTGKRGKNDAADAAAICEAVQRPHMRFVPAKSLDQQSQLMVHRARQGFVEQRTATLNRIRGLLSEFGIVLPLKAATVRRRACECLDELPAASHHQGRRPLPAQPAGHGRTCRAGGGQEQDRCAQPLGGGAGATARPLENRTRRFRDQSLRDSISAT